jgi:hypothetical protein
MPSFSSIQMSEATALENWEAAVRWWKVGGGGKAWSVSEKVAGG